MTPASKERMIKILTAPSIHVSALMTTVLVTVTQLFMNAVLLSPWNPVRCSFWQPQQQNNNNNNYDCSPDEHWILNWYSFAKFHLCLLLFSLSVSTSRNSPGGSSPWLEVKVGFLTINILMCIIVGGVFSIDHLNRPMAAFQVVVMMKLIGVLFYWISNTELRPGSAYLVQGRANKSRSLSMRTSSFSKSHRHKIAIPTVSLGLQIALSIFRTIDMTFGSSKDGYLGDASSVIYQNISNLAIADMTLIPLVMIFAFTFGQIDDHRAVLKGQVVALFLSQIILSSQQGDMIAADQRTAGMAGTFASIVISVVGSL